MKIHERRWIADGPYPASAHLCMRRRITAVRFEAVSGIVLGFLGHHRVARRLGDHRRGRDRQHFLVAFDDGAHDASASTSSRACRRARCGRVRIPAPRAARARDPRRVVALRSCRRDRTPRATRGRHRCPAPNPARATADFSRSSCVSSFESRTPERCSSPGTTAATVTGPAHEPRPTSSMPTTIRSPSAQHFRSTRSVGYGAVTAGDATRRRRVRSSFGHVRTAGHTPYDGEVRPGTRVEVRSRFESDGLADSKSPTESTTNGARRTDVQSPAPFRRLDPPGDLRRDRSARGKPSQHVVDLTGTRALVD